MEKYHKTDISPMEKENERDENYPASNPQIDSSRTKNNYHIIKRTGTYTEYINGRIAELNLPQKPRSDAVLMASFVIGSDKEFFAMLSKEEQEYFFSRCTMFFGKRYGLKNIISAVVHIDETTPHMHLNLIPIKSGRLCAKELFNRNELTKLQTDFYEEVGKRWGLERGKEGSQAKHLSTAEYKAEKIIKQAQETAKEMITGITAQAQTELQEITRAITKADKRFTSTMQDIKQAQAERDKAIEERNAEADYSQALDEAKQGKFALTKGGLKNQIVVLTTEVNRLEKEVERQKKDIEFTFGEYQKVKAENDQERKATRAIAMMRKHEPEAFARVFFRAASILDSFIPQGEPPVNIGRKRLQEIEKEIEEERKREEQRNKTRGNNNSKE